MFKYFTLKEKEFREFITHNNIYKCHWAKSRNYYRISNIEQTYLEQERLYTITLYNIYFIVIEDGIYHLLECDVSTYEQEHIDLKIYQNHKKLKSYSIAFKMVLL